MTFLNLALLGGVLALAIPIIIHLFHKSRFQVVAWGAMHLLEAVLRTNQRRIRIEQWILLAIRCAIPAILALCMARPVWRGFQKLLGDAKTSTVILLDNSYSMAAGRAGTSNFAIARDEAARLLNELKLGSDAQIILMGEGGAPLLDEPTYDLARLTQALAKVEPGYGAATVPSALDYAANVLGRMHESRRQVVVMTDFQRVSFEATEDALVGQMIDRLKKLPLAPELTFWNVGSEVRDNVAVESLDFSRLMIGVGQKIQVRANVRNFGDVNYPDLRVYFRIDGKEKSVSQLKLGPHEKGQVLFTHAFDTAGSHVVEVVADADTLKADNNFLASIPVRDKVPLLLVNGDPSNEPLKGETAFAEIALQPYSAARVELADLIKTAVIRADELNTKSLTGQAVVILANVRRLKDDQLRAIEDFVAHGGGLLIFPGDRVDANWYNSAMLKDGKGLLPLAFGAVAGDLKEGAPAIGIVSQRYDNPALELFNDPRNGSLSDAQIRMWFRMQERTRAAGAPTVTTLAKLDSGDIFLAEKPFGEGRVIACAVPCDADWSNLPMRPFYLPFVQRLSVYLASTIFPPRNLDVGKPIVAFLAASDAGKKAMLAKPDGATIELSIAKKGDRGVVEFA
ncbi:MAG TPA: BatA domain-containing protein, partial [Chthoniobacteraceae bacterium]|nr:BatA domain-containing protein [Chthoniobacteraceae bacterium]